MLFASASKLFRYACFSYTKVGKNRIKTSFTNISLFAFKKREKVDCILEAKQYD